ncbi:AsmA family protein [Candidatus Tisiphia endosymbiont of Thecophora atra]|uniref:AsmA family protein n=1 Tax=Candidatus Tisiphia endosymbiont of Thecophora atra TaxID=3066258 RepID=UPI00312CAE54
MQKFLKYSAGLFILIIVILLIIPLFISLESYKGLATDKVKEITGRELQVNGKITLSLLPTPTITVRDIKLASLPNAHYPSLLEVKEVSASLSILSLFRGNIEISKIEINKPVLNLERMRDGVASWEFPKIQSNVSNSSTDKMHDKNAEFSLDINLIKIVDAKLNYVNFSGSTRGNSVSPTTIDIDRLEIKNLHGPSDLACQFYSSGKHYDIKGNIEEKHGSIALTVNLNVLQEKVNLSGDFAYDNMTFVGQLKLEGAAKNLQSIFPDIPILHDLDHKLTFNINSDKKSFKISSIDFTAGKLSATSNANFYFEDNKGDLSVKLLDKPFSFATGFAYLDQNLLLNNINLIVDKANITGNIGIKDWDKDLVISYNLKISDIPTIASLFGKTLPVNLGDVLLKGETIKQQNLLKTNSIIMLAKTTNNIKGTISLDKVIKPAITIESFGDNLGQTIGQLTTSSPNKILGSYSLSTQVEGDMTEIIKININKFTVALKKNPVNFSGAVNINLTSAKPKILSDIKIASLNLDDLSDAPPNSGSTNSVQNVDNSVPWSKDTIDLSFLNKFDGDLTLTIQKIIKGSLIFDSIKTTMLLANGVLDIKSLNGNLYGGTLIATGKISSQINQPVSFKASIKDAELKNIVPQGGKIKVTQGVVNCVLDLKTKGQSQLQYVSNLFGKTTLTASNGKVSGFDLQKVLDSLKNIKDLQTILKMLDGFFASGETKFQKLAVDTEITEGIVNITHGTLDAPSSKVAVTGNINLPAYTFDTNSIITVDIKLMPPFKVRFYGYLNNPQHKLDTKALQQYLVKNLVNSVVNDVKKGKKPEDILKDIIGVGKDKKPTGEEVQNDQDRGSSTNGEQPTNKVKSTIEKGLKGLFK